MTKNILYVLGVVFIVVGLLGFVNNPILGIFATDTIHNLIHLASGILAFVFASKGDSQGRTYALVFGIVYALITVLGFLTSGDKLLGFITINGADNWLHLILAVVLLIVGLRKSANTPSSMAM